MSTPTIASIGVLDLVAQAGPVGKCVLALLFITSIFCWAIIIAKWRTLKYAAEENLLFLDTFWHGKNIEEIFIKSDKFSHSPVAAVFKSGVKELRKLSTTEAGALEDQGVDNITRALMRASNSEIAGMEKHIGWLATTASAAPFVGLFGTVWGIIDSFQKIGVTGSANLAVVAPGISEALIATAAGLFAAVPAVVAHNYFAGTIKRMAIDIDCFSHDFLNIIQRKLLSTHKGA